MKIIWLPKGLKSFFRVFDFVKTTYGEKTADKFAEDTRETIKLIREQPNVYEPYEKKKQVRKGFVNKFVSMFYKVKPRKKEIEILHFWENRQDPKNNKF